MSKREIWFTNETTVLSQQDCASCVVALQKQLDNDIGPLWNHDAELILANTVHEADGKEQIKLLDNTDQAGALGYHDEEGDIPYGKVFVKTDMQYKQHWTSTTSHELAEQLEDPLANDDKETLFRGHHVLLANEIADPVENDEYQIDGIWVSNVIKPIWFLPGPHPAGTTFDLMGKVHYPLTLSPGGYMLYCLQLGQWKAILGDKVPSHQKHFPMGSRRYKRLRRHLIWGA